MNIREQSLEKHYEWQGKIEVNSRVPINTMEELSLAYTPGVAEPCLAINKDYNKSFELTLSLIHILQYTTVKHKVLQLILKEDLRDGDGKLFKFNTHMFRKIGRAHV